MNAKRVAARKEEREEDKCTYLQSSFNLSELVEKFLHSLHDDHMIITWHHVIQPHLYYIPEPESPPDTADHTNNGKKSPLKNN